MSAQLNDEDLARRYGAPLQAEKEPDARTWQPVDLTSVLDGTWMPPQPTVGRRTDGRGLFYPGRCHTVVSETEGGKTWFALSACLDEMRAGHHVVYLDFEDDEGGIVGRLLTLGVGPELIRDRFHYIRPEGPLGTGSHRDDLYGVLVEHAPTLAILDGVTEAMTLHGLDPLNNSDASVFNKQIPRWIAATGPAVASLDHVTKSKETRGRYAIGAVHKINALNGAQYLLENRRPFGVGATGASTVRIAKDRIGQLRSHALPGSNGLYWYGDLVLDSHPEGSTEVSVDAPREQAQDSDWRPTVLMARVTDLLAQTGPLPQRDVATFVNGRRETVIAALRYLILDGYATAKSPHALIKPYPEAVHNP